MAQLEGLSARQAVLMVWEDLHWSDPTTRESLDLLIDRVPTLRVLVILTFRPEFTPPWIGRPHVTMLTLNRLPHGGAPSAPHSRGGGRVGHRWGTTEGKIGLHGGKVTAHRPRVRGLDGHEVALPSWTAAQAEDWLGRWAMKLIG